MPRATKRCRKARLSAEALDLLAKEHESERERLDAQRQALQGCLAKLGDDARELVVSRYKPANGDLSELAKAMNSMLTLERTSSVLWGL